MTSESGRRRMAGALALLLGATLLRQTMGNLPQQPERHETHHPE